MTSSVTHFEIYAEDPAKLAEFYRTLLGWQIEKAPGIDYWRIDTGSGESKGIGGGLLFRPIPGPRSWVHYVHVDSLDQTVERIVELGGAVVRPKSRRAEDGVVRRRGRPRRKHLRHLAGRPVGDAAARTRSLSRKQKRETETRRKVHALHRRRAVSREHATTDHHRGAVWADVAAGRRARHPRDLGRAGQGGGGLLQRRRQGLAPPRAQPRDRAPLRGHRTLQLHDGAPQGSRAPR